MSPVESTPLIPHNDGGGGDGSRGRDGTSSRMALYEFLEAKTNAGKVYEGFIILLILLNVLSFILASLFVEEYNPDAEWAKRDGGICNDFCDMVWFGNYDDNGLQWLGIGATSYLELITVAVFSIEYILRLVVADLESSKYQGFVGRLYYVPTFFSVVDLASTLPFYIDAFILVNTNIAASGFLRMFRLLRMMRVEGRYDSALTMVDDVYEAQKGILFTALFVGLTTWLTVSSCYYLAERRNVDMIYCPSCPDADTSNCIIDEWGIVLCDEDECDSHCYNLFESIPMASYFALLNLFGEFPLIDDHNVAGKVVGTLTAIIAVAVFALPAGIIGNGFEDVIAERNAAAAANADADAAAADGAGEEQQAENDENGDGTTGRSGLTEGFVSPNEGSYAGWFYNLLHGQTAKGSIAFDYFINTLIVITALTFMIDTLSPVGSSNINIILDCFELFSVIIFTLEYSARVYSITQDPNYNRPGGRFLYMGTFLAVVDLLSVLPYWFEVILTGKVITSYSDSSSTWSNIVKSLRLLRILRFEKYTHAFTSFDDVISKNADVLAVTGFTAILIWVFFSAFLYFTERNSLDPEMSSNYNTVPNSMWVTLLNLSGEAPLCQYSIAGKIATGILGLFATGIFGIPIGVLGAGFEEVVEEENEDNVDELEGNDENDVHGNGNGNGADADATATMSRELMSQSIGSPLEETCYKFVNGIGSSYARNFEIMIYILIFVAVSVGVWQTVEGEENTFSSIEFIAVIVFTIEYVIRFVGVGADPEFATNGRNGITSRFHFLISFYSVIDLLAIIPFYLSMALPNSIVNEYDEYLRMLRILRLLKLDKYIPSISLIDDVFRLKYNTLRVAFYAALTLWILFAAAIFIAEHQDYGDEIDNLPLYGCVESCTMADRFQNFFDSMVYTGIHLTGDYPIIEYSWPARFINFFMVIAAVGVVSIPSGLIASGFVEIVQSKNRKRTGQTPTGRAGDDWYEIQLRALQGVDPPPSPFGPTIDRWQIAVNEYLNGTLSEDGTRHEYKSAFAFGSRIFIFTIIVANVVAVVVESMPSVDKAIGNEPGNFFDQFEAFSVTIFAIEYMLRLFCAPKNREALYSSVTYATTFFGIVDFLSTAPWFIEEALILSGHLDASGDNAKIFRIFRIFRILQLEDFVTAFSKLDNVFRASQDVLKATGLMALIIWVFCGALFYIFEENNPNWRICDDSVPLSSDFTDDGTPGCYDFKTTSACNEYYPGLCDQKAFVNMPNALYYTAVFLGGEWGVVDFTWPGRMVCLFLCIMGIGIYAIPVGTLFDSFGAVLGLASDDDDDDDEGGDDDGGEVEASA